MFLRVGISANWDIGELGLGVEPNECVSYSLNISTELYLHMYESDGHLFDEDFVQ